MLKILLIDDSPKKVKQYRKLLESLDGINMQYVDIANSFVEVVKAVAAKQYDLAILDLYLPYIYGDDPKPENAVKFLELVSRDEDLYTPYNIVGITQFADADPKYKAIFDCNLMAYILYSEQSDDWKNGLRNKIHFLLKADKSMLYQEEYDYDVAIINALQTENDAVKSVLGNEEWEKINVPVDKTTQYYSKELEVKDGHKIRVVTCFALDMASTASAMLTTKVIYNFRPRYLFMTGIAAGVDRSEVNIGDIMIATNVWNGASGKIKTAKDDEDVFAPDYRQLQIEPELNSIIRDVSEKKDVFRKIKDNFSGNKPDTELQIHLGPIVSVPAVLSSKKEVEKIQQHSRKLMGIEMEGYGMFYAAHYSINPRPKFIGLIKSVSDYADPQKGDDYQAYAAYTSAAFVKYLITEVIDI